ncbi:hypothetical protein CA13_23750 [Planctomycetes bacterium CA13]|uniref:Uncharacterized protein n=1 Tax=Novipirellula herctigrandis TaxID=2527986 RepID=A0A5C5Z0V7_9BACT|nr:hypothetical protein CA13_23750 [Planctomycetes bacterium CA13]
MEPTTKMNPYAPSMVVDPGDRPPRPKVVSGLITTHEVGFMTIVMTMVSGGLFAVTLVALSLFGAMLFSGSSNDVSGILLSMLMGTLMAFGFGAVFALIAALPVVPICAWIYTMVRPSDAEWTPTSIRLFGCVAGGATGYVCVAVPGLLTISPEGFLYGFVPAIFAAISVPLLLHRLARRCQAVLDQPPPVDVVESELT